MSLRPTCGPVCVRARSSGLPRMPPVDSPHLDGSAEYFHGTARCPATLAGLNQS
eukprot:CAMPEP_0180168298 /NCGR_PEP_ID=MMETSP0986-20121125/32607_1 /TAXON_ID=697907 /ORGANISM="non described non described, Strain CCMP2293" /LENGTH=53 /DNA_ID=CAMNT_0022119689 /DNA_START=15 /DNA_END=176 /DNA_ORIENTATION=-